MPYTRRGPDGQIDSLHRSGEPGMEFLPDGHPDLNAFVGTDAAAPVEFGQLDAEFVRVIEDVIDTLIIKNILNITDLPDGAQAKLFARKTFRERIAKNSLRLFSDSECGALIGDPSLSGMK